MKRNLYISINQDEINVYSNLSKMMRNIPGINYFKVYRALTRGNEVKIDNYTFIKTILK